MKELNEIVQNKLNEMASEGKLAGLIEKHVEALVADSVSDIFRSYSPLSKSLKASLEAGLAVSFDEIDYSSYHAIMLSAVQGHIDNYFGEQVRKDLDEQLVTLLGAPPKEMTIGELADNLVKIIRDDLSGDYDDEGYHTNIMVSSDNKYGKGLKISTEGQSSYRDTQYVHLFFGESGDSIRINHNQKQSFNPTAGFNCQEKLNAYIFKLYVAKTKITGWDKFDPEDHNDYCEADA